MLSRRPAAVVFVRVCVSALALLLADAATVRAQHRTSVAASEAPASPALKFVTRAGAGYVVELVGIVAGAALGFAIEPSVFDCKCGEPGAFGVAYGGALGAIVGASLGAALTEERTECSFGRQWRLALIGTAATVIPGAIAAAVERDGWLILAAPIVIGPLGAATALHPC